MIGGWVINGVINIAAPGLATLDRVAIATNRLRISEAELTGAISSQEAAWLRLGLAADAAAAKRRALVGKVLGGTALVGAAAIADSVTQAAKLQRTLIAIRNETGANTEAMGKFYDTVFKIGNIMGVSPATAGTVMLNISRLTAGTLTTAQMQAIAPAVARFAATIHFNRPDVSVESATQAGIQLTHLFRAYQPAQLTTLLDRVYRLSGLMVESPRQAVRQMSYYEPLFKGMNIDDNTSVALMALLDRAGFRYKVGTNVRAMLLSELGPLALTKHYQEGRGRILEQMGVFRNGQFAFNTAGGGVDFMGMLASIAHWAIRLERAGTPRSVVSKDIYGALGKQGGTIATVMADPQMLGILAGIEHYLKNPSVSLASGDRNRQSSLIFQAQRVWGNFQAVLTELGYRATGAVGALKAVADRLHEFQAWMHSHKTAADWLGNAVVALTSTATIAIIARSVTGFLRLIGLLGEGGLLGRVLGLGRVIGPVITGLGSLASGIAAIGYVIAGAIGLGTGLGGGWLAGKLGAYLGNKVHDAISGGHAPSIPSRLPRGVAPHAARLFDKVMNPTGHGTSVHVNHVSINFPNVKDGAGAKVAMEDLFLNPRSMLYTSALGTRTHPNLPQALTVAPA